MITAYYRRKGRQGNAANERRESRRRFGVSAYVGANGGGKTTCMIWDVIPALQEGRPALSTVRLQDWENPRPCDDDWCASNPDVLDHFRMRPTPEGRQAMIRNARALFLHGQHAALEEVDFASAGVHLAAHPLWIPWTGWQQLLDFRFGEVLADEMTGIAEARSSMSLPSVVLDQFQQLRRDDIPFRYTMPAWEQADVSLRRPTQAVTLCSGKSSVDAPADGDLRRVWKSKRFFTWRTYDAMQLTDLTEGKRSELSPEVKDFHWSPSSGVMDAYDTFAPVLRVGKVAESGRCHQCGGARKAPVCACGPIPARVGAGARMLEVAAAAKRSEHQAAPSLRVPAPSPAGVARRALAGRHAADCIEDTPTTVLAVVESH